MGPPPVGVKGAAGDSTRGAAGGEALLVIDVQERLAPAVPSASAVIARIVLLVEKARENRLPILASEQYSRGLGPTVEALSRHLGADEVIEKIHFAAPREAAFAAALAERGITRAVVAGMEAHVCVQQTVLALLAQDVAVTVVGDAVASRRDLDRRVALVRLARAGAAVIDAAALLSVWPGKPAALSRPAS